MRRALYIIVAFSIVLSLAAGCGGSTPTPTTAPTIVPPTKEPTTAPATDTPAPAASGGTELILATTTSTQDSGLLDVILPVFEQQYNVQVSVVAVGTGAAIKLGQDGNADVLLVHARAQEDAFMAAGDGVRREDVMYNDFVIVGPESDPAGIKGVTSATEAFTKIAQAQAPFVSRGDNSGTNTKELEVWKAAGITPSRSWYISAGQGMGAVLTMANEQQAYTLSDRATYLARTLEGTDLVIEVEGDPILFNPYGVIAVNPAKSPKINNALANTFIDWIVSLPTQELIGQYGVAEFGSPLFTPDSAAWRAAHPATSSSTAPAADVALRITGNVEKEMAWTEAEVETMPTMQSTSTNKSGQASTYTGVSVNALLDLAAPKAGATKLTLVGSDGSSAEVSLAEVRACSDCIVSFRNQGGFSMVLPGFDTSAQIKGVVEIQVS